jgi:hypothetical protein
MISRTLALQTLRLGEHKPGTGAPFSVSTYMHTSKDTDKLTYTHHRDKTHHYDANAHNVPTT